MGPVFERLGGGAKDAGSRRELMGMGVYVEDEDSSAADVVALSLPIHPACEQLVW